MLGALLSSPWKLTKSRAVKVEGNLKYFLFASESHTSVISRALLLVILIKIETEFIKFSFGFMELSGRSTT